MLTRRGAICSHLDADYLLENISLKITKFCIQETQSCLWCRFQSIWFRLYIIIIKDYVDDIIILFMLPLFALFQYKYLPKPYKAFKDGECVVKQQEPGTGDRGWPIYTYKSCLNRCFALAVSKICKCIGFSDTLYGLQFPVSICNFSVSIH